MMLRRMGMACLTTLGSTGVMTSSPILILGGAGKTGRRVATRLGVRGVAFRLASRSSEPRIDWYDESTWPTAVHGAAVGRFVRQAVGDVATEALLDDRHLGQTYALSGPRPLTLTQAAEELTAATGRRVEYLRLDPDEHVAEMCAFGVPRPEAEAPRDLFAVIRNRRSEYVSGGVGQVLGRQPRDFTARARATKGAWTVRPPMGQASHDVIDGTLPGAAANLVRAGS